MPVVRGVLDPWQVIYVTAILAQWLDRVLHRSGVDDKLLNVPKLDR